MNPQLREEDSKKKKPCEDQLRDPFPFSQSDSPLELIFFNTPSVYQPKLEDDDQTRLSKEESQ